MFRLRVIVALIVLLLLVQRLELLVLVDLGEDALVVEYLERAHSGVTAILEHEQVRLVEHFLHPNRLVVSGRLGDFSSLPLAVLDLSRMLQITVAAKLANSLLILRGHVLITRDTIFFELVASCRVQKRSLCSNLLMLTPFTLDTG